MHDERLYAARAPLIPQFIFEVSTKGTRDLSVTNPFSGAHVSVGFSPLESMSMS